MNSTIKPGGRYIPWLHFRPSRLLTCLETCAVTAQSSEWTHPDDPDPDHYEAWAEELVTVQYQDGYISTVKSNNLYQYPESEDSDAARALLKRIVLLQQHPHPYAHRGYLVGCEPGDGAVRLTATAPVSWWDDEVPWGISCVVRGDSAKLAIVQQWASGLLAHSASLGISL